MALTAALLWATVPLAGGFQSLSVTTRTTTPQQRAAATDVLPEVNSMTPALEAEALGKRMVAALDEYESLAGPFDRDRTVKFFARRPLRVAQRLARAARTARVALREWDTTGDGEQLRRRVASMGPVATKVGQTLSQRPDLVGEDAAEALKGLQSQSPNGFSNADARRILAQEWGSRSLFVEEMSPEPVAVASLGQVYKAKLKDGRTVAVKIQRPDALRTCALDFACFAVVFGTLEKWWRLTTDFDNGDVGSVVDTVAKGVFEELDYRNEARNAEEFEKSLEFLNFVRVPKPIWELTTRRVLVSEWIDGKSLDEMKRSDLKEGKKMSQRAVEACTASLILTGFVHCDPHAENLLWLPDDEKLVFLDFGLVARVDPFVMEQFATGIRACVAGDYDTLSRVFQNVGFLSTPLSYRKCVGSTYELVDDISIFSEELAREMATCEGGQQRFGALAEVLGNRLGKKWKMFTPPYVILLTRTFLTLEGICAQVDPDFDVYRASMPWAIRRALSPTSTDGVNALRGALFRDTNSGKLRFNDLVDQFLLSPVREEVAAVVKVQPEPPPEEDPDVFSSVVLSPEGSALRRALTDVDTTDLAAQLTGPRGQAVRHVMAHRLCDALDVAVSSNKHIAAPESPLIQRRRRRVLGAILRIHLQKQRRRGWRGLATLATISFVFARVGVLATTLFGRRLLTARVVQLSRAAMLAWLLLTAKAGDLNLGDRLRRLFLSRRPRPRSFDRGTGGRPGILSPA